MKHLIMDLVEFAGKERHTVVILLWLAHLHHHELVGLEFRQHSSEYAGHLESIDEERHILQCSNHPCSKGR